MGAYVIYAVDFLDVNLQEISMVSYRFLVVTDPYRVYLLWALSNL